MPEPSYKVVWPLGRLAYQPMAIKPRPTDLKGMTICELSDYGFRAEEIFPIIRQWLSQRYPHVKFIEYPAFGNIHGAKEDEIISGLAEKLRKYSCDAVISGVGG